MWLRDSANQMQSYLSLLNASTSSNSLASLYRGVINLQSRYLLDSPYCNSFQPPEESQIPPSVNDAASNDFVRPPYADTVVFECKYELDSLAAFLEISTNYYDATSDLAFFSKYQWVDTIKAVMNVANSMMIGTYRADGAVNRSPYTFRRQTTSGTETLSNNGRGNPVQGGTGLIRSAFRPSDDATIYQLLIPANMMFAQYLNSTSAIVAKLENQEGLATQMSEMATSVRAAIEKYGVVTDPVHGDIYAFEIDGYGSQNIMDDANIPSLLSAPVFGYLDREDRVYQNTRKLLLSSSNSYFMRGPVINAIGGPHNGFGYAWPMASIVRILTSDDNEEIRTTLKELVSSTNGLGLIHESINTFKQSDWTRQW
jgi:meiotically up-regulated gene 157 (Mug157) protein